MAAVAAVLLTLYLAGISYGLLAKPKQPDPQRGQAIGCLLFVALGLLLLGGVLALAAWQQWTWLVRIIFYITVFPAVLLAIQGVRWLFISKRR